MPDTNLRKRDERGCRIMGAYKKKYQKSEDEPGQMADLQALLDVTIEQIGNRASNKPPIYDSTEAGLTSFLQATKDYFEYIRSANSVNEEKVYPDIEGWCIFLGITRQTVLNYAKRSAEWAEAIAYVKDAILAAKKQLAFRFKIPPIVYLNDISNNHGYLNTSEFRITATGDEMESRPVMTVQDIVSSMKDRQKLKQEMKEAGWIEPPKSERPGKPMIEFSEEGSVIEEE